MTDTSHIAAGCCKRLSVWVFAAAMCLLASWPAQLTAQVRLTDRATVYFGSPINSSAPATISFRTIRNATPEWQQIESQGIRRGSARYRLLVQQMHRRICKAADRVAGERGLDLVVRKKDITDAGGHQPIDITSALT